jgi:hypothetical protein
MTSLLTFIGLILPLFSYICSGSVPALVTLRKGGSAGLQVIIGSLFLTAFFAVLVKISPYIVIAFAVGVWLPVWLCANVLRVTGNQGYLILSAAGIALLYIILIHLLVEDVTGLWRQWLTVWLEQTVQPGKQAQLQEIMGNAVPLMNAIMAAGLFISLVATLLISRWWQAGLFNPGGFKQEFYSLQLPRGLIAAVAVCLVFVVTGNASPGTAALEILVLLIFVYLFQGLASVHRLFAARNLATGWLVGIYVLIFIVPQLILFLACLGMADSWLIRTGRTKQNDNS